MYMIEIIVKSIETFIVSCHKTNTLHAQFRVTLFDNFNDMIFLRLQQLIIQYDVCNVLCAYQTNLNISTKK